MSKKITLAADGATAVAVASTITDAFSTIFSTTEVVTGMEKYIQLGALAIGATVVMNKVHSGSLTNFGGRTAISY